MLLHSDGRNRELIDEFHRLDLCISYDRYLSISDIILDSAYRKFQQDGLIIPSKLNSRVFTVAAGDNIDFNPSSTLSQSAFHGNVMTIMQPMVEGEGKKQDRLEIVNSTPSERMKTCSVLSEFYDVNPYSLQVKNPQPPKTPKLPLIQYDEFDHLLKKKYDNWIKSGILECSKNQESDNVTISWGAYHSNLISNSQVKKGISTTLPVSEDPAHSYATIKHELDMYMKLLSRINPGQVGVIALSTFV